MTNRFRRCLVGMLGVLLTLLVAGLIAAEKDRQRPAGPPPLEVDDDAPLLGGGAPPGKEPAGAAKGMADNSACHVCHTNFQQESLAFCHAKAKIGCVKCHGQSLAHRNDEANITAPDIMYAAGRVDALCQTCHDGHDVPAAKIIARWQQCCPAKTDAKKIVCTDCHGEHRLAVRTVRWDKETRKLLSHKTEDPARRPGDGAK
ncbi:MAG: hypothetical protein ABSG68_11930 [Thermoguttaceae bacterium]|jgi:hypothetical protein